MILQSRFLPSKALYAVALPGLTRHTLPRQKREGVASPGGQNEYRWIDTDDPAIPQLYRYEIPCVWYKRRKRGDMRVDTANIGVLWDVSPLCYTEHDPPSAVRFLENYTDGRLGADCLTRWDGEHLWSFPDVTHEQQQEDLVLLRWMLDHYPEIPPGFSGWWSFR